MLTKSTCQICGSPVIIHTSDEGTSCYLPVISSELLRRTVEFLTEIARDPAPSLFDVKDLLAEWQEVRRE